MSELEQWQEEYEHTLTSINEMRSYIDWLEEEIQWRKESIQSKFEYLNECREHMRQFGSED